MIQFQENTNSMACIKSEYKEVGDEQSENSSAKLICSITSISMICISHCYGQMATYGNEIFLAM